MSELPQKTMRDASMLLPRGSLGVAVSPAAFDRYSRRVALLRLLLPAMGVSLLLLVAAWPRLHQLMESVRLSSPAIDLRAARELTMVDPRYNGLDRFNRPYTVTAAVARQIPDQNDLLALKRPRAHMRTAHGGRVVVTAGTGIYQSQAQLLDLFNNVDLVREDGTRFRTKSAHLNLIDNTADGRDPVEGHGPAGDVWGQGFRIRDKGDEVIFTGRSTLVLKGSEANERAAPPPLLPPAIAKTAALIESAAIPKPLHKPRPPAELPVSHRRHMALDAPAAAKPRALMRQRMSRRAVVKRPEEKPTAKAGRHAG